MFLSACNCGVQVDDKSSSKRDSSSSSNVISTVTFTVTNTITNDDINESITRSNLLGLQFLEMSTPIDSLKNDMFVWLDVSIFPSLSFNSAGKLTNWDSRIGYAIGQTNITTNTVTSTIVSTITTSADYSYQLTSPLSATPKSDVGANDALTVFKNIPSQGTTNYVKVDYEGSDRVGFKIDTSSMGNAHQVEAFYLVTEWVQGNNQWHIPLGYDNLGNTKRFFTKNNNESIYVVDNHNESKDGITLNEHNLALERNFTIPNTIHLISARGLGISKSALNNVLGTFPPNASQGGEQKIRELLVFTNDLTALEHSNMVRYLVEKWNISRQTTLFTNLYSDYNHDTNFVIENAVDNNITTTFKLKNRFQHSVNGKVLFQFLAIGSVLDPSLSLSPYSNLVLNSGNRTASDALKAGAKVEIMRKLDVLSGNNSWYTLTNFVKDDSAGPKFQRFALLDTSNDFIGYRLVATENSGHHNWLEIDDFSPTRTDVNSSIGLYFSNTLVNNKIYDTNDSIFTNGFTNTLVFYHRVIV